MKQYRPAYYKDFRCIASACKDNCCIGWEIDIDEQTAAFYRSVTGDFGCRLKENILREESGSQFILNGERCPFLNEKNLCDIYIHLGESALCEICTQHPRYHEWYGDWKESGVGLCCEAAGRLIFSQTENRFELVEIEEENEDSIDEELFSALFIARETAIKMVEQGNYALLPDYGRELQITLDEGDLDRIRAIAEEYKTLKPMQPCPLENVDPLNSLLDFMMELEPIDPNWPALLQQIKEELPQLLSAGKRLEEVYPLLCKNMEQLAIYFLFRYFCKALFDGDVLSKVLLPLVACGIVTLLDRRLLLQKGSFDLEDQVFTAKQFSKEIEYCSENLDALADHYWEVFSADPKLFSELCSLFS